MKRILADRGPLAAPLDVRDADHADSLAAARQLKGRLVTTRPVVTETGDIEVLLPPPKLDTLAAQLIDMIGRGVVRASPIRLHQPIELPAACLRVAPCVVCGAAQAA